MKEKKNFRALKAETLLSSADRFLRESGVKPVDYIKMPKGLKTVKRKEIIHPILPPLDYKAIVEAVQHDVYSSLQKGEGKNTADIAEAVLLPHMVHDMFSVWYNSSEEIKMLPYNPAKTVIIESVLDHLAKIITEENVLNSYYFTSEILRSIIRILDGSGLDKNTMEKLQKALNGNFGEGSGNGSSQKGQNGQDLSEEELEAIRALLKRKLSVYKDHIEAAKKRAQERGEEAGALGGLGFGKEAGDIQKLQTVEEILKLAAGLPLSHSSVQKFLEKVLQAYDSYFHKGNKHHEDPLLESTDFDEILDFDPLILDALDFDVANMMVSSTTYQGKFDLYIDYSGSMGSHTDPNSRISLAKALALKLMKIGIVRKVYFFNHELSQEYTDPLEVLKYTSGGGTNFDPIIQNVIQNNRNSVVITDAECNIGYHHKKVLFIGVDGSDFSYFASSESGQKFLKMNQCLYFHKRTGALSRARMNDKSGRH